VLFPQKAPWLEELEAELFAFPNARYDDQADSISQALGNETPTYWDEKSLDGYRQFVEGLWRDRQFALLSGRPW
jgi:hypothetical protein